MNIIQIVSDTFRRDRLGIYGNNWIHTPYLDRFGAMSTVFDKAYICSFPTVPARYEFLTGKVAFPTRGWEPMPRDQTTIAEYLREKGYISMMIFDTANLIRHGFNYAKGFDAFEWIRGQEGDEYSIDYMNVDLGTPPEKLRSGWQHNLYQHRRSTAKRYQEREYFVAKTMSTACDWLERNYKWEKFFLYVDTFDPHEPWDPPEWYIRLYEKYWNGDRLDYPIGGPIKDRFSQAEIKHIRAIYAAEVTLVDKWVGRLLEKIEDLGLFKNTMVIFTTDHGTQQGEHGIMMKGQGMYEEVCHIPLFIYYPGVKSGQRAQALVQIPDVAATVVHAAGAPELEKLDGYSLLPLLQDKKSILRTIAPCSPNLITQKSTYSMSITDGIWSLVFFNDRRSPELYYLPSDPKQLKNIISEHKKQAYNLFTQFIEFSRKYRAPKDVLEYLKETVKIL